MPISVVTRRWMARAITLAVPAAAVAGPFAGAAEAGGNGKVPAPVISASVGPSGTITNQAASTISWTDSVSTATFSCSLDGAKWQACTSAVTLSVLDGAHRYVVRATGNGHKWTASTFRWTVDTLAPAAPVLSQPNDPTSATSATVTFSDSDAIDHYVCALDGATVTGQCGTSTSLHLAGLSEMRHTATVTAYDAAGNSAAASVSWTVDHTAPNSPTIDTPPDAVTNATSASIAFHDDDKSFSAFDCTLDGATTQGCGSPFTAASLAEGPHTFSVTARDATGNTSQSSGTSWRIDLTPPTAPSIVTAPASPTDQTTATVTFSDTDPQAIAFRCTLNGTIASCPAGSVTYSGLADKSSYTLVVTAVDAAGNTAASAPVSWQVDTAAIGPAEFISGPSSPSNDTDPTFTFDVGPTTAIPNSFICALDPADATNLASYTDCTVGADTGYTIPVNGDGRHNLYVRANYTGGPSAPARYSWLLDTSAPTAPAFSTTPPSSTTSTTALFSFASDPDTHFTCVLDGGATVPCASPVTYRDLGVGTHTFTVTAIDPAGNTTPATFTWTVTAPAQSSPPPSNPPSSPPATLPGSAAPGDTTAPVVSAWSTPTSLTGPAVATFSETVTALDPAAVRLVVVGTSSTVASSVDCLSGSSVSSCAGSFNAVRLTPSAALVPGQRYTMAVDAGAARDLAGNASTAASNDFRATTVVEETDPAVRTTWAATKNRAAYGRSYVSEHLAGATASWSFTGRSVTWWTVTGPAQGKASVFIDGARKATINNYAGATKYHVGRVIKGLANKRHTLRIVVLGVKGAKAGTGTVVTVDAFTVGKTRTVTPTLTTTLRSLSNSRFLGSHAIVADTKSETVSLTFRGTGITWWTMRSATQGKVGVYVDGVLKATLDNYAARTAYRVQRSISKLSDTVHTIKLVVLGTHHKGGKGTMVTVDRFTVA